MKLTMQIQLIPGKRETVGKALIEILRAMSDGLEDGRLEGGAPNGGHWSVDLHGVDLKQKGEK